MIHHHHVPVFNEASRDMQSCDDTNILVLSLDVSMEIYSIKPYGAASIEIKRVVSTC